MDTTSTEGQSSLDELIGQAHFRSATHNRGRSIGFKANWKSIGQDAQLSHIERGKIFLETLAKLQQQAKEQSA
jgi:hypothetical protein